MDLTLIFTITGILLSILIPLGGYFYKKRKEFSSYYSLVWKSVSKLKPRDFLGERPYNDVYFERDVDKNLLKVLEINSNALIVGPPLSGKTRAVYNSLKKSGKNFDILATRNISMSSMEIPAGRKFWKKKLIFIDDFQNFVERQDNYHLFFKAAKDKNIPVISTCHSGREYRKAKNKLLEQNLDIEMIFSNIFEIDKVSAEDGKSIAEKFGVQWDNVKFNGTIGSIFMKLSEMEKRYDQCDTVEKTILRSLRNLYIAGVYEDTCTFRLEWIKKVASRYELAGKDFEWIGWMKNLEDKEFILLVSRNKIRAEDAYLEYIIKPETKISDIELLEEMSEIFNDDAGMLMMIGERIYDLGSTSIDISNYMKLAIWAFEKILKMTNQEDDEAIYFKASNYLGMSYWSLSKVDETIENCKKSIGYYHNILMDLNKTTEPTEYAITKNKIGNTLCSLAEAENKIENCRLAIDAYTEALSIFTVDSFPHEYAQANNNLGGAYLILSDEADASENLKRGAECFKKSLIVRTAEFPMGYAITKNNLANTYAKLSQLEDTEKNIELALNEYNDILKIYKKEKFPLQYGLTMNNIGNAYSFLAQVKDKKINCNKAIGSYEEALRVRTVENMPVQFSNTMFNLGDTYLLLNEADDKTEYLCRAIECIEESIKLSLTYKYLQRYGEGEFKLGKALLLLSMKEDRPENLSKSMKAFDKALEIFTEKDFPDMNKSILEEKNSAEKKIIS